MTMLERRPAAADFARFGALIDAPTALGDRRMLSAWLRPVEGLALQFHINAVAPSAAPLVLTEVERHPHAAQVFVPMDVSRYVVTVAPSAPDGSPDMAAVLSFEVPGTRGVIYAPGVWHAGAMVLDRPGHFAVLMYRGAPDDDEFRAVPPLTLSPLTLAPLTPAPSTLAPQVPA